MAFGDILERSGQANGSAVGQFRLTDEVQPFAPTGRRLDLEFHVERLALFDGRFHGRLGRGAILGCGERGCLFERHGRAGGEVVDGIGFVGPVQTACSQVGFPASDLGQLAGLAKQRLLSAKLPLGELAAGHVEHAGDRAAIDHCRVEQGGGFHQGDHGRSVRTQEREVVLFPDARPSPLKELPAPVGLGGGHELEDGSPDHALRLVAEHPTHLLVDQRGPVELVDDPDPLLQSLQQADDLLRELPLRLVEKHGKRVLRKRSCHPDHQEHTGLRGDASNWRRTRPEESQVYTRL